MTENEISKYIIDCAIKVHKALGPGLLESAYEACLAFELRNCGLNIETQKPLPVIYNDIKLDCGYRIDVLVEGKVIIELKVAEALNDVHFAQILTYLKLSNCRLGLLINFNVTVLKNGIRRVANKLNE